MENALESGDRHRDKMNKKAELPSYKIGDKVLLFDKTTKKGQCQALTIKFKGPYEIIQICPGYAYKLQHYETRAEIKRPIHVNRIRPLQCSKRNEQTTVYDEMIKNTCVQIVIDDTCGYT
jgi:hypothetical protein